MNLLQIYHGHPAWPQIWSLKILKILSTSSSSTCLFGVRPDH